MPLGVVGSDSRTTKDEGTGLGLAIGHAIVEAHQGRIDVDSVVGRGTSFTIILPHPEPISLVEREQAPAGNRFLRGTNGADTAEPLMLMEETAHD